MQLMALRAKLSTKAAKATAIGAPILGFSFFLAWQVPRISPITYRQTDLLPIFLGLQALVAGHDPYSPAVGADAYLQTTGHSYGLTLDRAAQFSFHYPLPPALLYLPFSLFGSLETAILLLRTLTVALYLLALFCLIRRYASASSLPAKAGMLLWGIGWAPFLAVFLPLVQPTGIVLAALAFCLLAAGSGRWFWAGFALFFALLKPQDALPVLAVLAIYALRRPDARWRLLAGFAAGAIVPVAVAFLWRPDWLGAWLQAVLGLPAHIPGYYQNPPGDLARALGSAGVLIWIAVGALVLAWLALVALGSRTRDAQWGIAMGCALMVALAPRTGIYELAIGLLPWFYAWQWASKIEQRQQRRRAQVLLWLLWLAAGFLMYLGYGQIGGVAFGVGLVVALCLLAPLTPGSIAAVLAQREQQTSALMPAANTPAE